MEKDLIIIKELVKNYDSKLIGIAKSPRNIGNLSKLQFTYGITRKSSK